MSTRLRSLIVVLTLLACLGAPSATHLVSRARADGDPGSDELVYNDYFVGYDSGLSIPAQEQLGGLLRSAARSGLPVRVAIIAHPDDLGTVTPLWRQPQKYAYYLGTELKFAFKGRLLVVMPNGIGFFWVGHYETTAPLKGLAEIPVGAGPPDFLRATETAVQKLAAVAGVKIGVTRAPASAASSPNGVIASTSSKGVAPAVSRSGATSPTSATSAPAATSGSSTAGIVGTVALIVIVLGAGAVILVRRRRSDPLPEGDSRFGGRAGWVVPAATAVLALGIVALVVDLGSGGSGTASASAALETNPNLDPGQALRGTPAPNFTLYDEAGHRVSLRSFRGKVVILSFDDAECTTLCPLTSTAMLDAQRMLGVAGSKVQLLGVDANPRSIAIDDVLTYTQLHGMLGHWHFLTGSRPQLQSVWSHYHVLADIEHGLIDHTPALFVISPAGRLEKFYVTQQSYAAVGQLGQLLAREASRLLPHHPAVHSDLSYSEIDGIAPSATATLPRSGGGSVRLGPGHGAHLYVFFATWDQEVLGLGGDLDGLNGYAAEARRQGLPPLTAIDEGSVEPTPATLPSFLRTLPDRLSYPVAVDTTGRVADGYEVEGQPWFVLTSASGTIRWTWEPDTGGWPSSAAIAQDVRYALAHAPAPPASTAAAQRALAGSPAPLAALHVQASRLLGSTTALVHRIRALRGYPIVLNVWASWCSACQKEFSLFASASAHYGKQVAFLGADTNDLAADAQSFLARHPVSYPSYQTSSPLLTAIVPQGVDDFPTTIFIDRAGRVVHVQSGQYLSQSALDADVQHYGLDR